jgi:hypothetical protein
MPFMAVNLFEKRKDRRNTVLNWHRAPEKEFDVYAEVYWHAAQTLAQTVELDRIFGYHACPVVFLYRHALELYLKAIVLGEGANVLRDKPAPTFVLNSNHLLKPLLPYLRKILERATSSSDFNAGEVQTFDDFESIVEDLCKVDKDSYTFRYPVDKKQRETVTGHFTFNARDFARKMDDVLKPSLECPLDCRKCGRNSAKRPTTLRIRLKPTISLAKPITSERPDSHAGDNVLITR